VIGGDKGVKPKSIWNDVFPASKSTGVELMVTLEKVKTSYQEVFDPT